MAQNYFNPRTDLAVEEKERFTAGEEISGVLAEQWERGEGLRLTRVEIKNSQGAKAMGKPEGVYVTIEAEALAQEDPSYHKEAARELGRQLREMIDRCCPGKKYLSAFAAGLGNMQVTPDSLGPRDERASCAERHGSGGDGADGNGDSGDCEGGSDGDKTGSDYSGGRSGSQKRQTSGLHHPAGRYGHSSRFRGGKP